jgi:hypothetical protein
MKSVFFTVLTTSTLMVTPNASAQTLETAAQPAASATAAPETTAPSPAETAAPAPAPAEPAANTAGLLPTAATDGCELHLWPAERMSATTTGLLSSFGMLGAIADMSAHAKLNSNNQGLIATALDSPSQLDALQALDLRTLLNLTPGTTMVRHETPLERKTMNSVKTRRSDSTAECYSELIVADVAYQKTTIYGRSLKTLFMYRKFDGSQHIVKEYKAWGGNGLKLFPPKEGEDAVAALDELVGVYKKNFDEYARNARTSLARSSR